MVCKQKFKFHSIKRENILYDIFTVQLLINHSNNSLTKVHIRKYNGNNGITQRYLKYCGFKPSKPSRKMRKYIIDVLYILN